MTRKIDTQEPLLSAVARKLGRAAGTVANMTQKLAAEVATTSSQSGPKGKSVQRAAVKRRGNGSVKKRKAQAKKGSAKTRTTSRRKASASKKSVRRKG